MSSAPVLRPLEQPEGTAARMAREAALIAGRLAPLLGEGSPDAAFLQAMHETLGGEERVRRAGAQPFDRLAAALSLSPVELDLLALAGLPEEHEGYAAVLRRLHPHGEPFATVGLAARLLCRTPEERPLLREVLVGGSATAAGALRLGTEGPFYERSLRLADGLWPTFAGLDAWPDEVEVVDAHVALAGLDEWLASPAPARATAALAERAPCTILVTADAETVAQARALALCRHAGSAAVGLALPADHGKDLERTLGVVALAAGRVPVLRIRPRETPEPVELPSFARHPAPVVLCVRGGGASLHGTRPVVPVPIEPLSPLARRRMWRDTLPTLAANADELAARHAVEPATAAEAAADLRALELLEHRTGAVTDVSASVRARAGITLAPGVKLMRPTVGRDRLVVTSEVGTQLDEAVARLVHQSRVLDDWGFLAGRPGARGVRMLFTGPPGTGKTLAAEVMAHALGIDLLLVDVSRVVSKWIGETEKNLAQVFEVAERAQAVLFFDEADALFGKRTEVADAHDRYANLETAFLLARLERFEGLAVLSTNLRQNIDPAFTRRLEFVVEFDEPALAEREALWRCHLPDGAPLAGDVDIAELAALYPIVGALIRNAAVAAGFLAAEEGTPIRREHLLHAVRREYEKSGRAFPGVPTGPFA
jgi:SpoVK/Ycf46/Vps4 family AAA+-type ATPase